MESIPDETTILNFRYLLEASELAEDIFKQVNAHSARKGLLLKRGSIVTPRSSRPTGFLWLIASSPTSLSAVKNFIEPKVPALPEDFVPRSIPARATPRATTITALRHRLNYQLIARLGQCPCYGRAGEKTTLVTQ